jgi:hypothetical protein
MTTMIFIIPAAMRDAGNAMAEAMGWGGPVFVVPVSPTGAEPPTHWGFPAIVSQEFLALLANPPPDAAALVAQIDTDTAEGIDTGAHWQAAIAARGLVPVQSVGDL